MTARPIATSGICATFLLLSWQLNSCRTLVNGARPMTHDKSNRDEKVDKQGQFAGSLVTSGFLSATIRILGNNDSGPTILSLSC